LFQRRTLLRGRLRGLICRYVLERVRLPRLLRPRLRLGSRLLSLLLLRIRRLLLRLLLSGGGLGSALEIPGQSR
jgi:hypothetical protein